LAKFVGDLLGLDRLDSLEAGLKPLHDLRNLRKEVTQWSQMEYDRDRNLRTVNDSKASLASVSESLKSALAELQILCDSLNLGTKASEDSVEAIALALRDGDDEKRYEQVLDRRRRLSSIEREIVSASQTINQPGSLAEADAAVASEAFRAWDSAHGEEIGNLHSRISTLFPSSSIPRDVFDLTRVAMPLLQGEHSDAIGRAEQGRQESQANS
jgi:DNA repair protein SbcC/Rad50